MKILLTGACKYTEEHLSQIKALGYDVDFIQYESDSIDCQKYDGVVCNGLFLHHSIESFTNLKFIQLTSAGYDRVPLDYIKENNIKIFNAAGVYSIPIAEHAVLKILEFYKKSRAFYEKQKRKEWDKERNILELHGKKVAIIGCGNIGGEIAKRLKAFGTEITAVDIHSVSNEYVDRFENIENLKEVLKKSDIVILTLPLTDSTRGLINRECFSVINRNCLLVNVSRGAVINQADLIDALQDGKIAGAALDVFEDEPLPQNNPLWDMENVIITPHNSFVGEGNKDRLFRVILGNLKLIERNLKNGQGRYQTNNESISLFAR